MSSSFQRFTVSLLAAVMLCAAATVYAQQDKLRLVFVKYNMLEAGECLSVMKNNPVKAGETNKVILTLFNSGSEDYQGVTIRPVAKDRYLNVRFARQNIEHITVERFKAGAVKQLTDWPVVVTVAPTCPDGYKGVVYLLIDGAGFRKTIRQFVIEVSNAGILKSAPEKFDELYGGLGVRKPPVAKHKGRVKRKGGRSSAAINTTIAKYQMEVYYCYQQQLRKYPELKGKVVMRFTIRPAGSIATAKVVGSTIKNEQVEACLLRRIKTWKFDAVPKSRGNLSITYPFNFDNK